MRRLAVIGVASILVAGGSALGATSARPSLRLVSDNAVRGQNFVPHERVTIVVFGTAADGTKTRADKTVQAGARGGFTTTLPAAVAGGCGQFEIAATGSTGDHATYKVVPMCSPLPTG